MSETTRVRASSWARLFDCAYAWEGAHLLDYRKPAGHRALLGTSIHAGTAVYDQAVVDHNPISVDDAAVTLMLTLHKPGFEVDHGADDLTLRDAERIGLTLLGKYCREVSPRFEYAAVELETKPLDIDCGKGVVIQLTGTMDRSRTIKRQNCLRVGDIKSGVTAVQKGAVNTGKHAAQLGTYCLLTEHTTGQQVDETAEIIGMKTSGRPEIAVGEIYKPKELMHGTDEYPGLIEIAANMFRTGLFPPNPQSMLCGKKYCARWHRCPYHL